MELCILGHVGKCGTQSLLHIYFFISFLGVLYHMKRYYSNEAFSANISLLQTWYIYKLTKQKYPEGKEKVILQSLGFCICTKTPHVSQTCCEALWCFKVYL